ncbi:alcohol dehydrogenase [Rhizoctonia solani]|uniref:Alcohol dehydrogenase n=2 Tax=Rhizoctonia solani TaxID=456999 RepID=A0A8H8T0F7_9AGAM|nr:alcohol dehydrogenase [Rhizoctonia solani]QRW25346.1 alcohol dehydrogenase [Rhizoctonia solani]
MAEHKASLLLEKHGKLEVKTRPTPTPQKNQALVKVTAAAINPVDWKIIDYGIFVEKFPAVLGSDGAGVVEAVGPEVTDFDVGDRVFFQGAYGHDDETTFQEKAIVQTDIISKIPDNITDDQASTIPLAALTALVGLFQKTGVDVPVNGPTANGKGVLVLGGSSSVGQFAIQLARIAGFSPIVTTASAQHNDFLKSLGATHVFGRDASTQELGFKVLTTPSPVQGAHLATVLPPDDSVKEKNSGDKITVHNIFGSSHQFRDLSVPFWQTVGQWIKDEKFVPNRVQVVKGGLAAVPEAIDLSRKGHKASLLLEKHGKLEVKTRPTPILQKNQALVKVTAAAINPADWKIVDYGALIEDFPAVLGIDGAGVVEVIGPEVTDFKVGDRVFFEGIYRSSNETTFQEKTIVETDLISKIPDNITDDQASTIPVGTIAEFFGLFQKTGVDVPVNGPTANGKGVLVLGGSSSVGQFAIQLARIAGFSPIVTTASAQHNDFLKSLGATHVFGRDVDAKTIQSSFSMPVALVLDAISTDSTNHLH